MLLYHRSSAITSKWSTQSLPHGLSRRSWNARDSSSPTMMNLILASSLIKTLYEGGKPISSREKFLPSSFESLSPQPAVGFILFAAKLEEKRRRRRTCHEEIKKWDHRNGVNAQVGRTSRRNAEDTRQKGASRGRGLRNGRIRGTTVQGKHRVRMEEESLGKTAGRKLRGGSVR